MLLQNKYIWILLPTLLAVHSSNAQISNNPDRFEQVVSLNQLNSSKVENLWGAQAKTSYLINGKTQALNTATILLGRENKFFMDDFRLNFAGPNANKWHPGLAVEVGYLFLTQDFTEPQRSLDQHGFLFGGDWYFPLKILSNGSVVAKWAYVIRFYSRNMTIFNCSVNWNLTKNIGFYTGGDIYTKFGGHKYSGFVAGFLFQLLKRNS